MQCCYNTKFTLPKQSQRSRSVLQDGSRSLGLFWKEKTPSYNRRNTVLRSKQCNYYGYAYRHEFAPPFPRPTLKREEN